MKASSESSPSDPAAVPGRADAAVVLPLVEERLEVSVQRVDSGALRVRIVVDEMEASVPLDLVSTELRSSIVARGIEADERREPYLEGEDLVIPVYEERAVVERKLFLKEEVRLTRVRHERQEQARTALRRERAVIERQQPDGSWVEAPDAVAAPAPAVPPR